MEASPRVYEPRFSLDDISITSSTPNDIPETDSFIYNPSFASSDTSIASYKTEKTVNSRKSRYNALPRHKYAGIFRLPQGHGSFDVGVPKVCRPIGRDRHAYTINFQTESRDESSTSSPLRTLPIRDIQPPTGSRKADQVPGCIPFQHHHRHLPFAHLRKPLKLKTRTRLLMTRQIVRKPSLSVCVS